MDYIDRPTEYVIEVRTLPRQDAILARCRALDVESKSTTGHQCAIGACAIKIVARVCARGTYTLREFCAGTWLCLVTPPLPNQQQEPEL